MNLKIISYLILQNASLLGRKGIIKLIEHFGSAENVISAGWDAKEGKLFGKWVVKEWERERDEIENKKINIIDYKNPLYPAPLLKIADFPLFLYVKGSLNLNEQKIVAVIGTRNATLYGKESAKKVALELTRLGFCVISGLARGIDTAAHEGALLEGTTIAVIASGLSHIYPKENCYLAEKIASSGAIVSEMPLFQPPIKGLFPKRNRIISGMSCGVCLIESPLKGGGMLTMDMAEKQGKKLFTIPGRVDWPSFTGNHWLLKQKKAYLVESGGELANSIGDTSTNISNLNFRISSMDVAQQTPPRFQLTPEEEALIHLLPMEEKSIEELVLLTQLPIMQLNVLLTRLVLKKVVKEFPGKIYKKHSWEKP